MLWYVRLICCPKYKRGKLDVALEYKKILKNKDQNYSSDEDDTDENQMMQSLIQSEQVKQRFNEDRDSDDDDMEFDDAVYEE